ncbi:ATP-binding protein [Vannielia sp.]|uniref:sensor histidine kinase n=1 Tax=Vannielia sp. TaxID=2813045 RepID=UPI00263A012F|nr:ATP-binding protein [Vannielia sp.]MDF1873690.1 ATP-binding protein [Vannielia sp.]
MKEAGRFYGHIDAMRQVQKLRSFEFGARMLLMLVGAVFTWALIGLTVVIWWAIAYFACVAIEKALLHFNPEADSRRFFALVLVVSFISASVYAFLPIYLWLHPNEIYKFGTVTLVVTAMINVVLIRAQVWQVSAAYTIPIALTFLTMASTYWQGPFGGMYFWMAITVSLLIFAYFLVAVRGSFLTQKRLLSTQKQFFESQKKESIGTLASGIAHDFNNLLNVAQGNLELLRETPDGPERDVFIEEALAACLRAAALTRQLSALGRKGTPAPQKVRPIKALEETLQLVSRVVPATIELSNSVEPGLPQVRVDETTFQAALLNLAINARDAMPSGGKMEFTARLLRREDERPYGLDREPYVAFTVADTGTGVDTRVMGRIFDPFFTTKAKDQGTGLGLAMVDGFARQSGGIVHVESTPGAGSRFTIYLPAVGMRGTIPPMTLPQPAKKAVKETPGIRLGGFSGAPQPMAAMVRTPPQRRTA